MSDSKNPKIVRHTMCLG